MNEIEKVEKLREKANVSYADAKRALEQSGWDILDAVILLEQEGRVESTERVTCTSYSTKGGKAAEEEQKEQSRSGETFGDMVTRFFKWLGKIFGIGNSNNFSVEKGGETVLAVPVTVFIVLLIFCFWIIIPMLIIGLFFGFKYSLRGPDLEKDSINSAMHKATDVAEDIKEEFKSKTDKNEK